MGKTTVQMEGKMAAVPCHHGGDIRAWWRSSQSRKHMPHLNEASAIQLYRQLARGKSGSVFTDLSHFKTLPQRLIKPNWTSMDCQPKILGSVLVLLCLSLPEFHPKVSPHVTLSSGALGLTMMLVWILDVPHSPTEQSLSSSLTKGELGILAHFFPILRTQSHYRRATFISYIHLPFRSLWICTICTFWDK